MVQYSEVVSCPKRDPQSTFFFLGQGSKEVAENQKYIFSLAAAAAVAAASAIFVWPGFRPRLETGHTPLPLEWGQAVAY